MKRGFTLTEVLIALVIVGIVAAMTIPTFIQNHSEKQRIVKLKQIFSTLSEAYMFAVLNNGSPMEWGIVGLNNAEGAENIYNVLSQNLKVIKNCGQDGGCFYDGYYKILDGSNYNIIDKNFLNVHKFVLSNGTPMYIQTRSADCSEALDTIGGVCALIGVDLNGKAGPNTWGEDLFSFQLTRTGILPRGTIPRTGSNSFEGNCLHKNGPNWSCAGWVIYNENMDYLHCDDLSWDGKHSCK